MKTPTIKPKALYWASFNSFELRLPGQCVLDCSQGGRDASDDVAHWLPLIQAQVEKDNFPNRPTPDKIRKELREYGAWAEEGLADAAVNWERLVWVAACNIAEDEKPDHSRPCKD